MYNKLPSDFYKEVNSQILSYTSKFSNYTCKYELYPLNEENIIKVNISGKAEVEDIKEEFIIADKIMATAKRYSPSFSFIIKFDSRLMEISSFKVRKLYLDRTCKLFAEGFIKHIAYIENRKAILAFSKLFMYFLRGLSYSIHKNETEADARIKYIIKPSASNINLAKNEISTESKITNQQAITFPNWTYTSKNQDFSTNAALINNCLLYAKMKGKTSEESINAVYKILYDVISFNNGKIQSCIIDVKEVTSISRKSRKIFENEAETFFSKCEVTYCILPSFAKTLFRLYKIFDSKSIRQIHLVNSFEEGVLLNQKTHQPQPEAADKDIENLTYEELKSKFLHAQTQLKSQEQDKEKIEQLTKLLGGVTWNDQFKPEKIEIVQDDKFYDLFETAWVLQNDIKEVLDEKTKLNTQLSEKVNEQVKAIAQKECNLRNIINNSDKIIWLIDKKYNLLEANNIFYHFFHAFNNVHLKLGDNVIENLRDRSIQEKWRERYERAFKGEKIILEDTYIFNNKEKIHEFRLSPIIIENEVTGVSIRGHDITTRKSFEKQLQSQNDELRKVNSELDHFVYSVSHDLKAPLNSLMGLIEISNLETDFEKIKDYIQLQEKSVKRLDSFIKDIIQLSRNSRAELKTEQIDAKEFFNEIITDFQFMEQAKSIKKNIEIIQTDPLFSDKFRLKIILSNLISNAIRYADFHKENPFINIFFKTNAHNAEITIEDNGQGIKAEHHKKIFDMFYRANISQNGSGLGLYILRESLNKLGGSINMKSEYGKGTTFKLIIPNEIQEPVKQLVDNNFNTKY